MLCECSISTGVGGIVTCFGVGIIRTWLWARPWTGRTLLPERVVVGGSGWRELEKGLHCHELGCSFCDRAAHCRRLVGA